MVSGLVYIGVNTYILYLARDLFCLNYQLYIAFKWQFLNSET